MESTIKVYASQDWVNSKIFSGSWNDLTDKPFEEVEQDYEQTFDLSSNVWSYNATMLDGFTLTEGQVYKVVIDSVEYEGIAESDENGGLMVMLNADGTIVLMQYEEDDAAFIGYQADGDKPKEVVIRYSVTEIKTIAPKYLPMDDLMPIVFKCPFGKCTCNVGYESFVSKVANGASAVVVYEGDYGLESTSRVSVKYNEDAGWYIIHAVFDSGTEYVNILFSADDLSIEPK